MFSIGISADGVSQALLARLCFYKRDVHTAAPATDATSNGAFPAGRGPAHLQEEPRAPALPAVPGLAPAAGIGPRSPSALATTGLQRSRRMAGACCPIWGQNKAGDVLLVPRAGGGCSCAPRPCTGAGTGLPGAGPPAPAARPPACALPPRTIPRGLMGFGTITECSPLGPGLGPAKMFTDTTKTEWQKRNCELQFECSSSRRQTSRPGLCATSRARGLMGMKKSSRNCA